MEQQVELPKIASDALARYSPTDAAIAEMSSAYMPLRVQDVNDSTGCAKVHAARMVVRNHRTSIERTRVALKADALAFGRAVDSEAKRLTGLLQPIEDHLTAQEEIVTKEAERKRAAEEAKKAERLRERMANLADAHSPLIQADVALMSDEQFATALFAAQQSYQAALDAERAATEERRKESERIAAERAELDKLRAEADRKRQADEMELARARAEQEAEARKIAAERAAIEAEKAEAARQAEIKAAEERAAANAREDARIEAERVAAEQARKEAMRPTVERLRALAVEIENLDALIPEFAGEADVRQVLSEAAQKIRTIAEKG